MEVDVTKLLLADDFESTDYQCSPAQAGGDYSIGKKTWNRAVEKAKELPLIEDKDIQEVKDYLAAFGAWDEEELATWSNDDVNAIVIQMVTADYQEMLRCCDANDFEELDWELIEQESNRWKNFRKAQL